MTGAEIQLLTTAVEKLSHVGGSIVFSAILIAVVFSIAGGILVGSTIDRVCQCIEQVGRGR